jgi:hypothetical protein
MRTINCRSVRREVEEKAPNTFLSSLATDHLSSCPVCANFRDEQEKLQAIMSSLGTVEAPDDFDFKLRARLATEKAGIGSRLPFSAFSFGFRSAAFATLLLAFAATLLLVSLRSNNNAPLATVQPVSTGGSSEPISSDKPAQGTAATIAKANQPIVAAPSPRTVNVKPAAVALVRERGRTRTKDFSASRAPLLNSSDLTARASEFPIQGSRQPLKVSVDDGRGSSRTISLPTVSFGSQRVLSQNTSPLIASARTSW